MYCGPPVLPYNHFQVAEDALDPGPHSPLWSRVPCCCRVDLDVQGGPADDFPARGSIRQLLLTAYNLASGQCGGVQ